MGRRLVVACALVCLCGGGGTGALAKTGFTKTDVTITASDGTPLASTLYEPTGTPPAGGWPAVVMFHGLGGTRQDMNTIAEATFANEGYAVLTTDHRGHGQSGGLFNTDGPREIQDAHDLFDWLAARPEIDRKHIGAWGISLGGGVVWNALEAGVPFAAAEVVETWVDLYQSLAPNNLSKSGAVFQFLSSVPPARTDPELTAIKDDALNSRNLASIRAYAAARSVRSSLAQIKTPVEIFQGRRDFAFGIEQGEEAYAGLGGPKRLYIGDFGHSPSTFPGPDVAEVFTEGDRWFNSYLKGVAFTDKTPVELAPDPWTGRANPYARLPKLATVRTRTNALHRTMDSRGKIVTTFALPARKLESFGPPVVTVTASTKTQAQQLVAVLEAVKGSTATIVSEGGTMLPARKAYTVSFRLISDTALIAKGSKLRLTLSWTSTAQDPANLLYLTGVPDGSSLTVKSAYVTLPVLKNPISG
jgi:alpha-beta hydrolase superfamily lysophospholipase